MKRLFKICMLTDFGTRNHLRTLLIHVRACVEEFCFQFKSVNLHEQSYNLFMKLKRPQQDKFNLFEKSNLHSRNAFA